MARIYKRKRRVNDDTWHAARTKSEVARVKRRIAEDPLYYVRKNYKLKYGLTIENFNLMFLRQDCRCGICGSDVPRGDIEWHVDHNHNKKKGDPGFIRGILCNACNIGGGRYNDDPILLSKAAEWFSK